MNTSPYLQGAIAAQARMEDARRDAENGRLVKSVAREPRPCAPCNWFERLGRRLRRRAEAYVQTGSRNARYTTQRTTSNAKI